MDALKQPCEMTASHVLPALRASLAKNLVRNQGLNQTEVSRLLGITQAAVSYYTSEKRGDESLVKEYPDVDRSIEKLVEDMCNGLSPLERQKRICKICRDMQNRILNDYLEE